MQDDTCPTEWYMSNGHLDLQSSYKKNFDETGPWYKFRNYIKQVENKQNYAMKKIMHICWIAVIHRRKIEPSHEIMVLFILHKLIVQTTCAAIQRG